MGSTLSCMGCKEDVKDDSIEMNIDTQRRSASKINANKRPTVTNDVKKSTDPRLKALDEVDSRVRYVNSIFQRYQFTNKTHYFTRLTQILQSLLSIRSELDSIHLGPAEDHAREVLIKNEKIDKKLLILIKKVSDYLPPQQDEELKCTQASDMGLMEINFETSRSINSHNMQLSNEGSHTRSEIVALLPKSHEGKQGIYSPKIHSGEAKEHQFQSSSSNMKILSDYFRDVLHLLKGKDTCKLTSLYISLDKPTTTPLLKKILKFSLPPLRCVTLWNIPKSSNLVKKLLTSCIPQSGLKRLRISAKDLIGIQGYLPSIMEASYRVSEAIVLDSFIINEQQLKKVFMAARLTKEIEFVECKFRLPRLPEISKCLKSTTIKKITLNKCDGYNHSDWANHQKELENLITGFSDSDLKKSLQKVYLSFDGEIDMRYMHFLFRKVGLDHVKVEGDFLGSYLQSV